MAEAEGNKTDGQDSASADSIQSLTSQHIGTYEEGIYQSKADGVAREVGWVSTGWAQAVSADERAQKSHRDSAISQRSRASSRAMYRVRQDWQRTVQGVRRQVHAQLEHRHPSPPYTKGNADSVWAKVWTGIFRLLGVE